MLWIQLFVFTKGNGIFHFCPLYTKLHIFTTGNVRMTYVERFCFDWSYDGYHCNSSSMSTSTALQHHRLDPALLSERTEICMWCTGSRYQGGLMVLSWLVEPVYAIFSSRVCEVGGATTGSLTDFLHCVLDGRETVKTVEFSVQNMNNCVSDTMLNIMFFEHSFHLIQKIKWNVRRDNYTLLKSIHFSLRWIQGLIVLSHLLFSPLSSSHEAAETYTLLFLYSEIYTVIFSLHLA